ncbi:LPS export ABC transporter permease LptF [Pasteurellaceae bacterium 22721_9_1]
MILNRYLTKEVFKSQIAILFILLLIFFSQQLVRVLGSAANGKVPADLVLSLLGLGMPAMAQLMLPLCLFIAILLTFGRLYAESEITVMRACGIGSSLLVKVALILSVLTAGLATYNALWLSPWAIKKQTEIVEDAKANPRLAALSSGQFMSSDNGDFVLFVNEIKDNSLNDIYIFQMKPKKNIKPAVVTAEKGKLVSLPNGDQLLSLENSQRVEGTAVLSDYRITHFEDYQAYLGRQMADDKAAEVEVLQLNELLATKSPAAKAELHWRITLILAVPLMALLAVPLSRVNPRQGKFSKILPALLLYLIYFLAQSALKSAGGAGKLDAGLWMPLVSIVFLLLAIILNSWESTFMYKFRYALNRTKVA